MALMERDGNGECTTAFKRPKQKDEVLENWGFSQTDLVKCNFTWTINNYSFYNNGKGCLLTSPEFSGDVNGNFKWHLKLKRDVNNYGINTALGIYLVLASCNQAECVQAKYKFSIINAERKHVYVKESLDAYTFSKGTTSMYSVFFQQDYNEKIKSLLTNDVLTIFCEVSVIGDMKPISGTNKLQFAVPECSLPNDLGSLLENKILSDVSLSVAGEEYQAHKAILAARSAVFAAMFEHEMKENKYNRVEITDMDPEVLVEMLSFIYTGKVVNLDKMAEDLLAAANKYALERLKLMCEYALCKNLSTDNAVHLFILADLYNANHLKAQVINFMKTQAADVMATILELFTGCSQGGSIASSNRTNPTEQVSMEYEFINSLLKKVHLQDFQNPKKVKNLDS